MPQPLASLKVLPTQTWPLRLQSGIQQGRVAQLWVGEPTQLAPPLAGAGLVQVLVWVPVVPQAVAEQGPKYDQPPSIGGVQRLSAGEVALQTPVQLFLCPGLVMPQLLGDELQLE
ncbi:MAG: hypothetical protein AAB547_02740 [Patescibacteria group bacterium]